MGTGAVQARLKRYAGVWVLLLVVGTFLAAGMVALGPAVLLRHVTETHITVPAWLPVGLLLLCALEVLYYLGRNQPAPQAEPKPQAPVERTEYVDRRIRDIEIVLDGKDFRRCEFHNADIVIKGAERFTLGDCQIVQCRILYDQPAAGVLDMFGALYQDPSFRPIVDDTFDQVRAGQTFS